MPVTEHETPDAVRTAKKRLKRRLRDEVRAVRRASKREAREASARRGNGHDLNAFLERTHARAAEAAAAALAAAASAACATQAMEACARRGKDHDVDAFVERTRARTVEAAAVAAAKAAPAAQEEGAEAANQTALEEFRKNCSANVCKHIYAKLPFFRASGLSADCLLSQDVAALPRRRVAVVGAGPVGLWAALVLAEKYRKLGNHVCKRRRPDTPDVVVMEARAASDHCSRTDIRIVLSEKTLTLLNRKTHSGRFVSGMPVADIEQALLDQLQKISPETKVLFNSDVSEPGKMVADGNFDCVFWAAGRRSLPTSERRKLACEVVSGDSQRVLFVQLNGPLAGGSVAELLSSDLASKAKQASGCPKLTVTLRPGVNDVCTGSLWIHGFPAEMAEAAVAGRSPTMQSIADAVDWALGLAATGVAAPLHLAAEALQQRLQPTECSSRWVEASFWSSDRVVCEMDGGCPLVLMGDAAMGRPFLTGTTLNHHFWDVFRLIDEVDWTHDGTSLSCGRFDAHGRRYLDMIRRISEFQRRDTPAPSLPLVMSAAAEVDKVQVEVNPIALALAPSAPSLPRPPSAAKLPAVS